MARARQGSATLVQTHVASAVAVATALLAQRNSDNSLILIHTSVLDSKTSFICLGRHGLRFTSDTHEPIGHSIPYLGGVPYHPNCRSSFQTGLRNGGPIPDANVSAWLRRQSTARQDEILGPTRAQMFRDGRLTARQLLESVTGRPLTLEELDG